ncbi:hypothetical protein M378DRAFT_8402 [Amanita muscaria Koide BX008]|uniref:Zn(2)-C6 fungal-type domain-containing protein n=1 Tax=Amanita muscaria (strain Koide BX008) TaxID=946122 RepID=A0A0C2XJ32_AMAMK|nr:hypothetical protein M378DRAFT_8402 [Amanita muscaria Koide BX008]
MPARKKVVPAKTVAANGLQSNADVGATKKQNACQCCRGRKLKCERLNGHNAACKRCEDSGMQAECTASSKPPSQGTTQRATRGHSLPPSTVTVTAQPQAETQTVTRTSRKRGYSETSDFQSRDLGQPKQHTHACKDSDLGPIPVIEPPPAGRQAQNSSGLEVIRESDEDQHEESDTGTQPMDDDQDLACQRTTPVMYTWSDTALNEDSDKSNTSQRSDDSDSSDDDSESDVEILEPRRKLNVHPGKKGAGQKPSSKRAGRAGKGNDGSEELDIDSSDNYDPETCAFKIPAAVKNSDGSYSPFGLESSISLSDLRNVIAERFDRHPRIIQLRYKLSNDKAKAPTTSIQNEDELQIFIEWMRALLVPQRLANGKVSKRAPKNITVYFEDPTAEGKTADHSDGKRKKKGLSESISDAASWASETTTEKRQKTIGELQKRWRCEYHSKGSAKDIYCYMESDGRCFELTLQDFSFWANQVIGGDTTVDVKPSRLLLHDARSTRIRQSKKSDEFSGSAPFQMGNHNYIPIPIMLPPTWHSQYPQTVGSTSSSNPQPSTVMMTSSHGALHSSRPNPESLQMEHWFDTLESDVMRNQKGVEFGKFGRVLAQNGFTRITQLSRNIISIKDLQDWLEIDAGTAAFIMEYAQEDVRQFKEAGGLLY